MPYVIEKRKARILQAQLLKAIDTATQNTSLWYLPDTSHSVIIVLVWLTNLQHCPVVETGTRHLLHRALPVTSSGRGASSSFQAEVILINTTSSASLTISTRHTVSSGPLLSCITPTHRPSIVARWCSRFGRSWLMSSQHIESYAKYASDTVRSVSCTPEHYCIFGRMHARTWDGHANTHWACEPKPAKMYAARLLRRCNCAIVAQGMPPVHCPGAQAQGDDGVHEADGDI